MFTRAWRQKGRLVALVVLLLLSLQPALAAASPKNALKAAFVREGSLWLKSGGNGERRLLQGPEIRYPKWSFDGEWIAYLQGGEKPELRLLHVSTGQHRLVAAGAGEDFSWSPVRNELAYRLDEKLYTVRADKPDAPRETAAGIGSFSWLPDGKGFIASTAARMVNEKWERVRILKIPLEGQVQTLYTLPEMSDQFFAVGTSGFKYSPSGKWIAFLAKPTASLSADGNYLCLLSADGASFYQIDEMLNHADWFQWADRSDTLAFISGVGREAYSNKVLRTLRIPANGKPKTHTPKGYADRGFAWEEDGRLAVSRAKEYSGEGTDRPLPRLVEVRLQSNKSVGMTEPPQGFGDFSPQFFPREQSLVWVRTNGKQADVLTAGKTGKPSSVWIKNLDLGTDYYGYWNWDEVLAVHG
ncbi:hypothetical protein [Cohnella phaseoli]|uniref:WD40 repeat protein n=1 Tax=Cohnella phaseoli TaxID=456490 RepID=A0A3D9HTF6_9BACL|nr:hypothetical protein [Cohnella phaseoli]RED52729.1 hypothetical protein DFP98_15624 [Cohnella phaseoli]